MKQILLLLITAFLFASCDCMQKASGIVLDKDDKQVIENVAVGKREISTDKPDSDCVFTDKNGQFDYDGISGGLFTCPDLVLYFNKKGYKPIKVTFDSHSTNDTVYLESIPIE